MRYQKVAHHHKEACLLINMEALGVNGFATDCWQDGVRADNENSDKLIRVCFKVVVASCVICVVWDDIQVRRLGG